MHDPVWATCDYRSLLASLDAIRVRRAAHLASTQWQASSASTSLSPSSELPLVAKHSILVHVECSSKNTNINSSSYEDSIDTMSKPHSKSTGQFGSDSSHTSTDPSSTAEHKASQADKAEHTAEKIRYGQAMSEGMGGKTNTASGQADVDGLRFRE